MTDVSREKAYLKPPVLAGYSFDTETINDALQQNRLLCLKIETNSSCNLHCRYCESSKYNSTPYEINLEKITEILSEAAALGAQSVVICGGGEPTLYSHFNELIQIISGFSLKPVVFTNAVLLDSSLCNFFMTHNVSVMAKLDSLRPATQDHISGVNGSYVSIQAGLHNLFEAGYASASDPLTLSLGISIVANLLNADEIEELWHFCRRHHVFPNVNMLQNFENSFNIEQNHFLSPERISDLKLRLLSIDREFYNYDWLPYTPIPASGCMEYLYSLYITINGDVRPCKMTKFDQHPFFLKNGQYPYNIFRTTLKEIYNAQPFVYSRFIAKHLQGSCGACRYGRECIGCRGYAYNIGIKRGLAPYEALRLDTIQCLC